MKLYRTIFLLTNPLLHHIGFISYGKGYITLNFLTAKNNIIKLSDFKYC